MKEIAEYIMFVLGVSLALSANVFIWLLLYDDIKERIKNRKHD